MLPPLHSCHKMKCSELYFSPGHKNHFPQIIVPIFPNLIFPLHWISLPACKGLMAALESYCMCMCVRIALTVPEKEMMYANLTCVFLDTPSPGDVSLQPRTRPLVLSPPKDCGGGEGIANKRLQSLYLSSVASAVIVKRS